MAVFGTRRAGGAATWAIVIIVTVALGAGAGWYFFLRSTPEKTMKAFVAAQKSGNAEAMKPLVSAKSQQLVSMMSGAMPKMPQGDQKDKAGTDLKIGAAKIEGGKATVPVTMTPPKDVAERTGMKGFTMNYVLIKENGKWVVDFEETAKAVLGGMGLGRMGK